MESCKTEFPNNLHSLLMEKNKNHYRDDLLSSLKNIYRATNQSHILINIVRILKYSNDIDEQMILGKFLTEQYFNLSHDMYSYYFCAIDIINKNLLNTVEKSNDRIISDFIDQVGRTFKYFPSDKKNNLFITIGDIIKKYDSSLNDIFIDFINFVYFDLNKTKWVSA